MNLILRMSVPPWPGIAMLLALLPLPAAADSCRIPGDLLHWQADYCMLQEETDDFLQQGVQDCFERETGKRHADACAAKAEYKRAMCRLLAPQPPYNGSVQQCFDDPAFLGRTVRNGGV